MFSGHEAETLKLEFKEHFRNVSRIMDCVGCDKCRLWGKLQVTGLGTALKLLFSYDDAGAPVLADHDHAGFTLSRSEVVAFINTLHRLSESLGAVEKFRTMWQVRERTGLEDGRVLGGGGAGLAEAEAEVGGATAVSEEPAPQPLLSAASPRAESSAKADGQAWEPHSLLSRLLERCQEGWRSCLELWEQVVVGAWRGRAAHGQAAGGGKVEL